MTSSNIIKRVKQFLRLFKSNGADTTLYIVVIALSIFGIIMIGDVSVGGSAMYGEFYATWNMIKQALFVIVSVGFMFFIARGYKKRYLTYHIILFGYIVCLMLMLICRAFGDINGAYAWIKIGPFTVQPVEFMKIMLILTLAYSFGELPERYLKYNRGTQSEMSLIKTELTINTVVIPFIAILIPFFVSFLYQNDLGSALIIGFISYLLLMSCPYKYMSFRKKWVTGAIIAFAIFFALFGGRLAPHQMQRFDNWFHPLKDPYNTGYQSANGLVAFTNGGLFGLGFGNSVMKFGYIPEAQNDFIIAVIVEELGLIGFIILLVFYCVIIYRLFNYAFKVKDTAEKLILLGISFYFFAHLFVNVGGVSGLIPMTGVPFLLISAGGTSTLSAMMCIGLAQGIIAKYNRHRLQETIEDTL